MKTSDTMDAIEVEGNSGNVGNAGNAGNVGTAENELMRILNAFPDAGWSYPVLSHNPNLSKDYILANIHKLNMKNLTYRFIHEPQFIYEHPELDWDTDVMCTMDLDAPFAIQVLRRYKNTVNFAYICGFNPTVNLNVMDANPDLPWNTELYAKNPYIKPETVAKYPKFSWNYDKLAKNLGITTEEYKEYVKLGFTRAQIIADQVVKTNDIERLGIWLVPLEYIRDNLSKCDRPVYIRNESLITWEFIQTVNPRIKWNVVDVIRLLLKDKQYDNILLVMNNCTDTYYTVAPIQNSKPPVGALSLILPVDFMLQHDFPWDWGYVMCRSALTWENIVERGLCDNPELSVNPNITVEIMLSNPQINWNFKLLSENMFKLSRR